MPDYQGYAGYGAPQSPQDAKMRLASSMMQNGLSTAPIRSPWQGAAQLAQALAGKSMMGQIQQGQTDANNTTLANSPFAAAAGGAPPVPPGAGSGGVATGGANAPTMQPQGAGGSPNGGNPFPPPPPGSGGYSPGAVGAAGTSPYTNDQAGHAAFIRARAAALGIDPNFALAVASAEGLRALSPQNPNGASSVDRSPDGTPFSFGDFQLNVRNGLGNEARAHGIDPANPNQWQAADEYALETMAKSGLQPWRGDAAVSAYQKQGGGWTPPPAGGGSALAFGGGPNIPPAVAAINGAAGAPGGFPKPPGQGGFPAPPPGQGGGFPTPPPAGGSPMGQIDPQTARQAQALLGVALNPNAAPETRQQAAQMYQTLYSLAVPHPSTWAAVPGTNDQRELDWLGRPTGRVIQGGPMQLDPDKSLYTVPPNDPTHPSFVGSGNTPPPNPAAGNPPPNAGATPAAGGPIPPPAPGVAPGAPSPAGAPRPGGVGMFPSPMTLPPPAGGAPQPASPAAPASQPAPQPATSNNGAIDPLANVKVTGEDYLASLANNPQWGPLASQARAILRGQAPFPAGTAAAKPQDQMLIKLLFAADPNFSAGVNAARMDAIKQFGDKSNLSAPGGMALSAETGLNHLGDLADSYAQMKNGEYRGINAVSNDVKSWFGRGGNPPMNDFELNKNGLIAELAKLYTGGVPTQAEIEEMGKQLTPNMPPEEFAAIAKKAAIMLQGKTDALQNQWHNLFGADASDYPILGPKSKAVIQRFGAGGAPQETTGGPPAAAIQYLRANPGFRDQFEQKYGPGSAGKALGNG